MTLLRWSRRGDTSNRDSGIHLQQWVRTLGRLFLLSENAFTPSLSFKATTTPWPLQSFPKTTSSSPGLTTDLCASGTFATCATPWPASTQIPPSTGCRSLTTASSRSPLTTGMLGYTTLTASAWEGSRGAPGRGTPGWLKNHAPPRESLAAPIIHNPSPSYHIQDGMQHSLVGRHKAKPFYLRLWQDHVWMECSAKRKLQGKRHHHWHLFIIQRNPELWSCIPRRRKVLTSKWERCQRHPQRKQPRISLSPFQPYAIPIWYSLSLKKRSWL